MGFVFFQGLADASQQEREDPAEDSDLVTILKNMNMDNNSEISVLTNENCEPIYNTRCRMTEENDIVYDDINEVSGIENSFDHMSILDCQSGKSEDNIQDMLSSFGFSKFLAPPLLCRHPPPATGRDDDISKIREILDDTLTKMGYDVDKGKHANRILCGPDNKIGKNILQLMKIDPKYRVFLPEFPLLHLRKSHITILFSAYQDAGLVQLMKFMRDDNTDDWKKLVSVQHIDTATRYVRRIALSLHLAFLIEFSKSLESAEQESFWTEMQIVDEATLSKTWSKKFEDFLHKGSERNATFALHVDMMCHSDHVVQIAFAERLGGQDGYSLMVAAVKESVRFLFVNNASSYAPYCVKLLYEHFAAGYFHKCMKETLFTTPIKGGKCNFASDTKRELDHLDAVKGFRSGSNLSTITCRMSLMDTLNESKHHRSYSKRSSISDQTDNLGWNITEVDENHIFPTTALILRQGGLSLEECSTPYNVYTKTPKILPSSILDIHSKDVGEYLLRRYLVKENMFQLTAADIPLSSTINGPSELVSRAVRSKGITIKRTVKSKIIPAKTESQLNEEKRQKTVVKESKLIDCLSSRNNACQAIVKPDSTKPKVMKSVGMVRAVTSLIRNCETIEHNMETSSDRLVLLNQLKIPQFITRASKICLVEFAGIKFKLGSIRTGNEYVKYTQSVLTGLVHQMPSITDLVVCEEKYSFTPDDFKAGTRAQRNSKDETSVNHLKTAKTIINENVLNKEALTKTTQGKMAVSTYLAEHVTDLQIKHQLRLIIDSELKLFEEVPLLQVMHLPCSAHLEPVKALKGQLWRLCQTFSREKGRLKWQLPTG